MPEPETVALNLHCAECGRSPRRGEVWSVYYADLGEAVTYCPGCAEREFGEHAELRRAARWGAVSASDEVEPTRQQA